MLLLLASEVYDSVKRFAVYYGYPSLMSGCEWSELDAVVLAGDIVDSNGDYVADTSHSDFSNTQSIVNTYGDEVEFFGYVPIGLVTAHNNGYSFEISKLQALIDAWANNFPKLAGIFLDEFGFDYKDGNNPSELNYWDDDANGTSGSYRERQKFAVWYCHSKGLKVIVNPWAPEDALSEKDEYGNYYPIDYQAGDGILWESFLIANGLYVDQAGLAYSTPEKWYSKGSYIYEFAKNHPGFCVYSTSTLPADISPAEFTKPENLQKMEFSWWGALLWGNMYFCFTDYNHGAGNGYIFPWWDCVPSEGTTELAYMGSYAQDYPQHSSDYSIFTRTTDTGVIKLEFQQHEGCFENLAVQSMTSSFEISPVTTYVSKGGLLSVKILSKEVADLTLRFFSFHGELMEEEILSVVPGINVYEKDVSDYPAGLYIFEVSKEGERKTEKFLVR